MSKRIDESSEPQSKLHGIIPYIDPKKFHETNSQLYSLNEKSDVYSVGVLLWEILSGKPPFCNEPYGFALGIKILQGLRETPIPNTPVRYEKLYTGRYNLNLIMIYKIIIVTN